MTSATTTANTGFAKDATTIFLKAIDEGAKNAYQLYWHMLLSFLSMHLVITIIILATIFIAALIRALMGRWGMLGSVLYNYLYFGILLCAGLIWGPNIFVSDFFHLACTILLYPACYFTVRLVLNRTGLRRI